MLSEAPESHNLDAQMLCILDSSSETDRWMCRT